MTFDQFLTILEIFASGAAPGLILHVLGWAAKPWARGLLSILPDLVGLVRRLQGKAGAPGAPNVKPVVPLITLALFLGCGGGQHPQLPPADVTACLFKLNSALGGQTTCDAIVRAIATVITEDEKCSDLLLQGLRCTDRKDGG